MKHESPLRIAAFFDTRPGHVKQTLGVLDALERLTETRIVEVPVAHRSLAGEAERWLKFFFPSASGCAADLSGCDFMIGTGSRTHIPMLTCRRQYRIPAVTCMSPTPLLAGRFDLCLVPRHDRPRPAANIFTTLGPPNRSRPRGNHDSGRGLVLIGGRDDKSHVWSSREIVEAVLDLLERERKLTWLITTSPRTPVETEVELQKLTDGRGRVRFVRFSETGPGWIEREYDRNRTVWVTADSMSMVFEALSAGCRVGVLPVAWRRPDNKFQRSVDDLRKEGYIVTLDEWRMGKASRALSRPLNEARRCAEEILRRWWPDRLP